MVGPPTSKNPPTAPTPRAPWADCRPTWHLPRFRSLHLMGSEASSSASNAPTCSQTFPRVESTAPTTAETIQPLLMPTERMQLKPRLTITAPTLPMLRPTLMAQIPPLRLTLMEPTRDPLMTRLRLTLMEPTRHPLMTRLRLMTTET